MKSDLKKDITDKELSDDDIWYLMSGERKEEPRPLNIGKALLLSLLFLLVFFSVNIGIGLLISYIFSLLLSLPILKNVTSFLLNLSENTPVGVASIIAACLSYFAVHWIMLRINREAATFRLIYRIGGSAVIVGGVILTIVSAIRGYALITGISMIIAGIVFIYKSFGFTDKDLK